MPIYKDYFAKNVSLFLMSGPVYLSCIDKDMSMYKWQPIQCEVTLGLR